MGDVGEAGAVILRLGCDIIVKFKACNVSLLGMLIFKRGCMRYSTMGVTLTSPIWLKTAMVAGNDLKLSYAKYFWAFISKKICVKLRKSGFFEHS